MPRFHLMKFLFYKVQLKHILAGMRADEVKLISIL